MTKEQEIISYLIKKFSPEVILLGGSRAKNTQRDTSDWDIYLIGDYEITNESIAEDFLGEFLDIALFPKSSLKDNVLKIFYGPLSTLKVLKDNSDNLGEQIIQSTKKAYLSGPKPLSSKDKIEKLAYLNRILSKTIGYKKDSKISFFHLAQFYREIFPFWFELENRWPLPVQYAIEEIKVNDLDLYNLLESLINEIKVDKKIEICTKILEHYRKKIK